jgi:hypothetical protein
VAGFKDACARYHDDEATKARSELGISGDRNKPLVARFIAEALVQQGHIPQFVKELLSEVKKKLPVVPDPDGVFG